METTTLHVHTGARRGVTDITSDVHTFVSGRGDGLVSLFVPHATAGVAIIETGAGSDDDFVDAIDRLLPRSDEHYRHRHGADGHGADHVIPGFVSPSVIVPVIEGTMALGTWQSIVLVDPNSDNPQRRVRLSFIPA